MPFMPIWAGDGRVGDTATFPKRAWAQTQPRFKEPLPLQLQMEFLLVLRFLRAARPFPSSGSMVRASSCRPSELEGAERRWAGLTLGREVMRQERLLAGAIAHPCLATVAADAGSSV